MGSACQGTRMALLRHDARRSTKSHHVGRFSGWQALSDVPALRPQHRQLNVVRWAPVQGPWITRVTPGGGQLSNALDLHMG
jgi:hypothetical protein